MTNNPTIDGVSRELLNQIYFELDAGTPSIATLAAIRALLDAAPHEHEWDINAEGTATVCYCGARSSDAPAVERQEPIKTPAMPYKMLPLEEDGWFQCVNAYEAMYPLYDGFAVARHSKRLIEQKQSTIAQLQARIGELESWQGEPK